MKQQTLFGDEPPARPPKKKTWTLVDHLCGRCFGRLVMRTERGETIIKCCKCGRVHVGAVIDICFCSGNIARCIRNPNPTLDQPNEILAHRIEP